MRILEIIHSLQPGGAERLVVDLYNQLSKTFDTEAFLVTLKNRENKQEEFFKKDLENKDNYKSLALDDGFKIRYIFRIQKTLAKIKPDVIHIHCILHYMVLFILLNRKIKFFYTVHNIAEVDLRGYRKIMVKYLIKLRLLKVITISDLCSKSFRNHTKCHSDKIIYNGRSLPQKSRFFQEVKDEINSFKGNRESIVLTTIARCAEQKNTKLLIEAVNRLSLQGYSIVLSIIGKDFDSDLGQELQLLAENNIRFLGPKNNIADYLLNADAFCLSSLYEGMPITLLEALACGCPPISTPVFGIKDLIEDGKTGFISDDFSLNSYMITIERFIHSRNSINSETLRDLFINNYSIEHCTMNYLHAFKQSLIN